MMCLEFELVAEQLKKALKLNSLDFGCFTNVRFGSEFYDLFLINWEDNVGRLSCLVGVFSP